MNRLNVESWLSAKLKRRNLLIGAGGLAGFAIASPDLGHSVHVDVTGLEPDRYYWYQFKVGNEISPVGRTRTAPATKAYVNQLNFAFASCQEYQSGFYTAYKFIAEEDLNFVVHLGDYLYEYVGFFIFVPI